MITHYRSHPYLSYLKVDLDLVWGSSGQLAHVFQKLSPLFNLLRNCSDNPEAAAAVYLSNA